VGNNSNLAAKMGTAPYGEYSWQII